MTNRSRLKSWTIGFALLMVVLACAATSRMVVSATFEELAQFRAWQEVRGSAAAHSASYTASTEEILLSRWGSGAILYLFLFTSDWGIAGLVVLKYLICFGIAIGSHGYVVRQGVSLPMFAPLCLLVLSLAAFGESTELKGGLLATAALLGLFHLIAVDQRRGGYGLWGVLPLMLIWANLHESCILGLIVFGAYVVSRRIQFDQFESVSSGRKPREEYLWVIGLAALGVAMINPLGWQVLHHFIAVGTKQYAWEGSSQTIWQSPSVVVQILFIGSTLIAAYGIYRAERWPIFESMTLLVTGTLAIHHRDYFSFYLVSWICFVPSLLMQDVVRGVVETFYQKYSWQLSVAALAIGMISLGIARQSESWQLRWFDEPHSFPVVASYPAGASDYLRQQKFSGNLFVPHDMGSYLSWRLYPGVKVSADSRLKIAYSDSILDANRKFYRGEYGWSENLAPSTDAVLVPIKSSVFKELTRESPAGKTQWRPIYEDREYAIFVRRGTRVADVGTQRK